MLKTTGVPPPFFANDNETLCEDGDTQRGPRRPGAGARRATWMMTVIVAPAALPTGGVPEAGSIDEWPLQAATARRAVVEKAAAIEKGFVIRLHPLAPRSSGV